MAKSANTSIACALYLRMSSDKQETSIQDQRKELTAYASKRGYRIIREYIDEGISGWKEKRGGFQKLIADAQDDGGFQLVLCWDQARFSRFDPMEANFYWHILRREGVQIETIKEGPLDFETLGGWLSASVHQHGKNEYVKSLAHDVARGQRAQRRQGFWITRPPYGYRSHNRKLVLGPPEEVEIVRRIFRLRAQGHGCRRIAQALNKERIKSPEGKDWSTRQILCVVRKRTYIGDSVTGIYSRPKFAEKLAEVEVMKGTHEPIIDLQTWEAVRRVDGKMTKRRGTVGQGEGAPLSGLMYCGCCGEVMFDLKLKSVYLCSAYHNKGRCHYHHIDRDLALRVVAAKIRQHVLHDSLDKLTAAIEKVLASRKASAPKVDVAGIRKQIAEIDRKLSGAADKLLAVEPSLVPTIEAKMLDLKRERLALESKAEAVVELKRKPLTAKRVAADIWRLDEVLRSGSPATVRFALSQIIERIEIDFTALPPKKGMKRTIRKPASGVIYFTKAGMPSGRH